MGADNQCPMPHVAKGQPADNVVTVVVGFPPIIRSPRNPFPSSALLHLSLSLYSSSLWSLSNRHSPSYFPPTPPSPSCPVIVRNQMSAQIPAEFSRYLQTCPYFSKNLLTSMLGQKTILKYSSESQFKKCSRRQNTSVNSYLLLCQLLLSCRQPYKSTTNILGNSPLASHFTHKF